MIQMIAGVFGLPIKGKDGKTIRIKGMGPNDGPFSVSPEREAELVKKGVARYVEPPKVDAEHHEGNADGSAGEYPLYNADMKADQLKEIGKQFGLTFKVGMKKTEMVAALDKHFGKNADDEDGKADADTDGSAGGDEDAPTFDPAGAVE